MKCPHCKKEIEDEIEEESSYSRDIDVVIPNFTITALPIAIFFSLLDKYTSFPLSIEDGLSWNIYLLPAMILGFFYITYGMFYNAGKVKGRFLIIK